jgi:hypothetical protein
LIGNYTALRAIYPCWLPLFRGAETPRDYPIPERDQEKGLEFPFHLMTSVAGALYPLIHDRGIYLEVHSRLLFPTSSLKSGSVQWHLITSPARRERLPTEFTYHHPWQRLVDTDRLTNARIFLGYCRQVVVDLGINRPTGHYKGVLFSVLTTKIMGRQPKPLHQSRGERQAREFLEQP